MKTYIMIWDIRAMGLNSIRVYYDCQQDALKYVGHYSARIAKHFRKIY